MVADDYVAFLWAKWLVKLISEITFPKNMVLHGDLQARMDMLETIKAMLVQSVRSINNLKSRRPSSSQKPLHVWYELNPLQFSFDVAMNLPSLGEKIVQEVDHHQGRNISRICSFAHGFPRPLIVICR